jgi:AGZA family xanthine/uracil permease-like MFS transporter
VVLASITVYIADRHFFKASCFALAGSVLTFFGLMHGESIGFGQTPTVAFAYVCVAVVLGLCAKFATAGAAAPLPAHSHAEEEEPGGLPELAD